MQRVVLKPAHLRGRQRPKQNPKQNGFSIIAAMDDPRLFRKHFKDIRSWSAWRVFLSVLFGLLLDPDQLQLFQQCTGRSQPEANGYREAHLVIGRRGGKSFALALIAVFLASFRSWTRYLGPGERGTIMCIAADRKQARTILRYCKGLLSGTPMLKPLIKAERAESIDLSNRITIEVHSASFRSTRGYSIIAALCDEMAFWRSEDSAEPDTEILAALRPGMVTIPDAILLCASSPYARKGALFSAYQKHFGKSSPVLVWQAATRTMNPSIPQSVVDQAYEDDPISATAEYGAQFRADVENFVTLEVVMACIRAGTFERPPQNKSRYSAFVDPSGGSADSFTIAIGHRDGDNLILDCVREVRPPFSPESVVEEFAGVLKFYKVRSVCGDRYGGEWPREQFRKHGIQYELAPKPKSDIYRDLLPLLNSRRVELLDNTRLIMQLVGLERRTARSGRDSIDHPPNAHDDLCNCVAGVLTTIAVPKQKLRMGVFGYGGSVVEIDVNTGHPIEREPTRIRWLKVQETDVPAARGPN